MAFTPPSVEKVEQFLAFTDLDRTRRSPS